MGACDQAPRPPVTPVPSQAGAPAAHAQIPLPSDPAEEKLNAWLAAVNAVDRAQIERLNEGAAGSALLTSRTLNLVDRTGGFDLQHLVVVESSASSRLV